ncbi:hypothetical protein [Roseiflexus sp.]
MTGASLYMPGCIRDRVLDVVATIVQTVGSKGYDGLALAVVKAKN